MNKKILAVLLLSCLACGGGTSNLDYAEKTVDLSGPTTREIEIEVVLDEEAKKDLTKRNEAITVHFSVCDTPMDDGTYYFHEGELPSEGGVLKVPPLSLKPGPSGDPIVEALLNVWTARKSTDVNLVNCEIWAGSVQNIPERIVVNCSLI
ncbi:MAG: hypothetical protein HN348_18725 [Proteobacteria bacterium]|jgi:hypothetical protein|nr:hypothetical protein [Pseudomonadota bacterium]